MEPKWVIRNSVTVTDGRPDAIAGYPSGRVVALTRGPDFDLIARARHARLIAAAPDLLAACEAALERIQDDDHPPLGRVRERLVAAIAAAKGEPPCP